MSAAVAGLAGARERLRASVAASDWMRRVGLTPETAEAVGLGLDAEDGGSLTLVYPQRGEDGVATVGRLVFTVAGNRVGGGKGPPSAIWSAPPYVGAEVVVARDPVAMWLLLQAAGTDGLAPALVVAATHRDGLPHRWCEEDYWSRFDQVTLMIDGLRDPDRLCSAMAAMPAVDVAGALPPALHADWTSYLGGRRRGAVGTDVRALIDDAPLLSDLVAEAGGGSIGRVEAAASTIHDLDAYGRLRRVLSVEEHIDGPRGEGGSRRGLLVVRSDRSLLGIVPVASPRGTRAAERLVALSDGDRLAVSPGYGACCRWSLSSAQAWAVGRVAVPADADLLLEVTGFLAERGLDPAGARLAASFAMFSYLYQCAPLIPLLVAVGGHAARCRFASAMAAICFGGRLVGRSRARQLARLADETGATMVFDEPGLLVSPAGPTELGRFVLSGVAPDISTEHQVGEGGLRTLRTFGPRILCYARAPALDWEDVVRVEIAEGASVPTGSAAVPPGLVDRLHLWAMEAVGRLGPVLSASSGLAALDVIAPGVARAPSLASSARVGLAIHGSVREDHETTNPVAPDRLLEAALAETRLRTGRVISIVQLTLEAALAGGEGEEFSPERIGRWLVQSGELAAGEPVGRRRLFGHISRLYVLGGDAVVGRESDDGFGFCTSGPCGGCRYRDPCARLFPALYEARRRRL